jgi:hypothetical protein
MLEKMLAIDDFYRVVRKRLSLAKVALQVHATGQIDVDPTLLAIRPTG